MPRKSSKKAKLVTRIGLATFVGVGLLTASAAAAAYGIASLGITALRPAPRALIISTSIATPSSDILVAGTSDREIARFSFQTNTEAVLVDRFSLHNCIAVHDTDGDCADRGEASESLASLRSLTVSYQDHTGATITNSVATAGDTATFTGQTFYIPARSTRTIVVYANTSLINETSVRSGMRIQTNLNAATERFHAVTQTSSRVLDESFIARSVMANPMTLRNTQPTFSLHSVSPSGITAGDTEALRFNVAADSNAPVTLNRLVVKVESTDNGATGWNQCAEMDATDKYQLWRKGDTDTWEHIALTPANYFADNGMHCGASTTSKVGYLEYRIAENIDAGTVVTYKVLVEPTGSSGATITEGDTLRLSLPNEAEAEMLRGAELDAVTWSDTSTTGTNIDARYLGGLALIGGTILY